MKNVLFIHDAMAGGGAERVLISILQRLDRSKFRISLLLIYRQGVFLSSIPADVEVLSLFDDSKSLPVRAVTHFRHLRNAVRRAMVRRLLRGRRFDTVVSFMEGSVAKLHSQIFDFAQLNVSWIHNNIQDCRWYGFWLKPDEEKALYREMDRIAFVSDGALEAFESVIDTNAVKRVIINPVDVDSIRLKAGSEPFAPNTPLKIITIGRLVQQKRQDRLIDAAAILRDKGFKFVIEIYGIGPLQQQLADQIASLNLHDYVKLMGFTDNPYAHLRQADIFCLTSEAEGFGMVVAEALAVGTPVVSTRVDGVTEMLACGGGVLSGDSPEDIADTLAGLMTDTARLGRLRAETADSAHQFDIAKIIGRISDFISGN